MYIARIALLKKKSRVNEYDQDILSIDRRMCGKMCARARNIRASYRGALLG